MGYSNPLWKQVGYLSFLWDGAPFNMIFPDIPQLISRPLMRLVMEDAENDFSCLLKLYCSIAFRYDSMPRSIHKWTTPSLGAWIFTEGLHYGSSREIGDIFQEDLKRSQWAEEDDHASIPLIGIVPWGILADRVNLQGINVRPVNLSRHSVPAFICLRQHLTCNSFFLKQSKILIFQMGSDEARYYFSAVQHSTNILQFPNALDPFHVIYILADDGTTGQYNQEPLIRRVFETFIKSQTSLDILGTNKGKRTKGAQCLTH